MHSQFLLLQTVFLFLMVENRFENNKEWIGWAIYVKHLYYTE